MNVRRYMAVVAVVLLAGCVSSADADINTTTTVSTSVSSETVSVDTVAAEEYKTAINVLDDLNGKNFGIKSGTDADRILLDRYDDPIMKIYLTYSELADSLVSGRIDSFIVPEPTAAILAREYGFRILDEDVDTAQLGFCFPKTDEGEQLCLQLDSYLVGLRATGELDNIVQKWTGTDEDAKTVIDVRSLTGENGTISLVTDCDSVPFSYFKDGMISGIEIDIITRFCSERGYALDMEIDALPSVLTEVSESKYDVGCSGLMMTMDRRQQVYFSKPVYSGKFKAVVRE